MTGMFTERGPRGGEGGPGGMGDGERERVTARHGKGVWVGRGHRKRSDSEGRR